jgi:hypothetical protein
MQAETAMTRVVKTKGKNVNGWASRASALRRVPI